MAFILIAEDEKNIADVLKDILENESHSVRVVRNGVEAVNAYREKRPDMVILDVGMPKKNGFDVCREIRQTDEITPILFLTARNEEEDKVRGFGLGADDYITKPFGAHELSVRIAAILRRVYRSLPDNTPKTIFRFAGHELDTQRFELKNLATGRISRITPQDSAVLKLFAENAGIVLSRDFLIDKAWGMRLGATTRTVDMQILKVRKLLGSKSHYIETVRSGGYRLIED